MKFRIYLASISALLTAISFPPYETGFIIYLSPILLLFAVEELSIRKVFIIGYIWGLIFNFAILYGVFWATIPGTLGLLAVMSLLPGLNCLVYAFISKRSKTLAYISWPLTWVGLDYLRTLTELAFPWADYGYTQTFYLPIIQSAEIFGVYGISLMIHIVNILFYVSLKSIFTPKRRLVIFGIALFLPLIYLLYGWLRLPPDIDDGNFKIAMLQGNITREIKWKKGGREQSLNTYFDMTRQADLCDVDLIIWPETAAPFYLMHEPNRLNQVKNIVDSIDTHVLCGVPHYDKIGKHQYIYFNSAILVSPGSDSIPIYEKIKLVPVSERIPFSGRFKVLSEIRLGQADFSAGRNMTIFSIDTLDFAAVICFESAFPHYCADFCRMGAEFLVVITNDMWFDSSSLPYQHARMSVLRAVENRVPLARCANTGVTMFIDRWGRMKSQTNMFERKLVCGSIKPEKSTSIYNHYGDILPLTCIVGNIFLILAVAFYKKGKYNERYES
ncbi:MAG: apolipoprotein N-acyltransferase [candidate division Zixibacteria bacterium]|nr:apolipoprotein N-acyltransferase [candidate division Zixibacteria bacterium]